MTSFRKGDRVKPSPIAEPKLFIIPGELGTVLKVDIGGQYPIGVDWDESGFAPMMETEVELIEPRAGRAAAALASFADSEKAA